MNSYHFLALAAIIAALLACFVLWQLDKPSKDPAKTFWPDGVWICPLWSDQLDQPFRLVCIDGSKSALDASRTLAHLLASQRDVTPGRLVFIDNGAPVRLVSLSRSQCHPEYPGLGPSTLHSIDEKA